MKEQLYKKEENPLIIFLCQNLKFRLNYKNYVNLLITTSLILKPVQIFKLRHAKQKFRNANIQ